MKKNIFVILISLLILPSCSDWTPKWWTIDMSLPASERLAPLCGEYKDYALEVWYEVISTVPKDAVPVISEIFQHYYETKVVEPYKSEIEYIAECTGLTIGDITGINLLYDLTAFCTSIVAVDTNGNLYHGRNLDYGFPALRNDTYVANYTYGDELLYTGTNFFGYVGLWTGQKPHQFTITADERDQGSLLENLLSVEEDHWSSGWLIRQVLSNASSYDEAVSMLATYKIDAPVYYIVGGIHPDEGVVITRNQTEAVDIWLLTESEYEWYLVETNYDHWTTPPPSDDRRDPAIEAMNNIGQANINGNTLYQVLSNYPVENQNTIYTTIMSAANPELYYATIRLLLLE